MHSLNIQFSEVVLNQHIHREIFRGKHVEQRALIRIILVLTGH